MTGIIAAWWREILIGLLAFLFLVMGMLLHIRELKIENLNLQLAAARHDIDVQVKAVKDAEAASSAIKAQTTALLSGLVATPPKGTEATRAWALDAAKKLGVR